MSFPTSQSIYCYKTHLVRVVDGDTIEAVLDLGFKMTWRTMVRFIDLDAYETRGAQSHPMGKEATRKLIDLFADHVGVGGTFYLHTDRDEIAIYNRVAGRPYIETEIAGTHGYIDVVESMKCWGYDKRYPMNPPAIDPYFIPAADIAHVIDPQA